MTTIVINKGIIYTDTKRTLLVEDGDVPKCKEDIDEFTEGFIKEFNTTYHKVVQEEFLNSELINKKTLLPIMPNKGKYLTFKDGIKIGDNNIKAVTFAGNLAYIIVLEKVLRNSKTLDDVCKNMTWYNQYMADNVRYYFKFNLPHLLDNLTKKQISNLILFCFGLVTDTGKVIMVHPEDVDNYNKGFDTRTFSYNDTVVFGSGPVSYNKPQLMVRLGMWDSLFLSSSLLSPEEYIIKCSKYDEMTNDEIIKLNVLNI